MKCLTNLCNAAALRNDVHCYFHSDKITDEEKKQARQKGGEARKIRVSKDYDNFELRNINDIIILNEKLINDVLQNKIELRFVTGIAYNLQLQMKLIQLETIDKRLAELEKFVFNPSEAEQRIKELFVGK